MDQVQILTIASVIGNGNVVSASESGNGIVTGYETAIGIVAEVEAAAEEVVVEVAEVAGVAEVEAVEV